MIEDGGYQAGGTRKLLRACLHVSVAIVATDLCRSPNIAQATLNVRFTLDMHPVIKVNSQLIVPLCQLPITASS
jgi:hypothetical protein